MSMESDLRGIIAGAPAVLALVADRIYASTFAQATGDPCIRFQRISGTRGLHMRGSDGLDQASVQIDVRALSAVSATAVRDALVGLLHGFAGAQGATDFKLIALRSDRGVRFEKTERTEYFVASIDVDVTSRGVS